MIDLKGRGASQRVRCSLTCSVPIKIILFHFFIREPVAEEFSKRAEVEHLSRIFAGFSSTTSEANLSGGDNRKSGPRFVKRARVKKGGGERRKARGKKQGSAGTACVFAIRFVRFANEKRKSKKETKTKKYENIRRDGKRQMERARGKELRRFHCIYTQICSGEKHGQDEHDAE